jgi:hypothetical protein
LLKLSAKITEKLTMSILKTMLLTFTFLSLISCDPVRLRRDQSGTDSSDALTTDSLFTTLGSDTQIQNGQGFEHCGSSATVSATNIGAIKACQNTIDKTNIRVQLGSQAHQEQICVVPMYQGQSGGVPLTTYQGANSGCFAHEANKVMVGVVRGDDPQYFGTSANSIMLIKQSQVNNFYECSDGINRYLSNPNNCCAQNPGASCQGIKPASQCQQEAYNYRASFCNQFKSSQKNINYL